MRDCIRANVQSGSTEIHSRSGTAELVDEEERFAPYRSTATAPRSLPAVSRRDRPSPGRVPHDPPAFCPRTVTAGAPRSLSESVARKWWPRPHRLPTIDHRKVFVRPPVTRPPPLVEALARRTTDLTTARREAPLHRRRRTALALSAALVTAAPLLAACGSDAHPGAAAVVGGDRIEVSTLQSEVKDVRTAQAASPGSAQLIKNTGQLSRAKLHGMILDRVLERAAKDAGVTVSRKEVQDAHRASVEQAGGEEQLAAMLLQQRGVAPDQIDQAVREDVLLTKLSKSLGADLGTPEGQQKVGAALSDASRNLHIDVNPRYGTWDDKKIQLGDYKAPWITQVTKEPGAVQGGA